MLDNKYLKLQTDMDNADPTPFNKTKEPDAAATPTKAGLQSNWRFLEKQILDAFHDEREAITAIDDNC